MKLKTSILFLACILFLQDNVSFAQLCSNRFLSNMYKGVSYYSFAGCQSTRANEIITAANTYQDNGIVAKFSGKGTPLFSYEYAYIYQNNFVYHSKLRYSDLVVTDDGGTVLAGSIQQIRKFYQSEYYNKPAILIKVDAFGNVIWSRKIETETAFTNNGQDLAFTNVLQTTGGDLITYLASDYGPAALNFGRILCFSNVGNLKWKIQLASPYDGGLSSLGSKRAMLEARDGSIIICDIVYQTQRTGLTANTRKAFLHIFALNKTNGTIKWEKTYEMPPGNTTANPFVIKAFETPDGNLVFAGTFTDLNSGKKALRLTTHPNGDFLSAKIYQAEDGSDTDLLFVTSENPATQSYIFKKSGNDILVKMNDAGEITWQQGLSHNSGLFPANTFTRVDHHYAVFGSNYNSRNFRILFTDSLGSIDCAAVNDKILVSSFELQQSTAWKTDTGRTEQFPVFIENFPLKKVSHPLEQSIDCEAAPDCCHDITDSTSIPEITICEGTSYILSGNIIVHKPGEYFQVYKTPYGCDSIVFYRIKVVKNPSALTLGDDQCFNGRDSIVLAATGGYEEYVWMNLAPSGDTSFTVKNTGIYYVRVTNVCGSKIDSISVFPDCDLPIYMPTAFTPNGDGRNDVFRVSPVNRNKFVSFKVFNRWGQVIYYSKDQDKGWDGTVNGKPQPTGVYVYFLQVQGLSGNNLVQKGTVLLIR